MNYSLEVLSKIKDEVYPLFEAAWDEVDMFADHMELDPDWEKVSLLEDSGMWRTYTLRNDERSLVGVICVIVQNLIHSRSNFVAITDVAYVKPEYRGEFREFLSLVEDDLKEEGVSSFNFNLKSWDKRGEAFKSMGYKHSENVYTKMVN